MLGAGLAITRILVTIVTVCCLCLFKPVWLAKGWCCCIMHFSSENHEKESSGGHCGRWPFSCPGHPELGSTVGRSVLAPHPPTSLRLKSTDSLTCLKLRLVN